jgi:hypothetical protein
MRQRPQVPKSVAVFGALLSLRKMTATAECGLALSTTLTPCHAQSQVELLSQSIHPDPDRLLQSKFMRRAAAIVRTGLRCTADIQEDSTGEIACHTCVATASCTAHSASKMCLQIGPVKLCPKHGLCDVHTVQCMIPARLLAPAMLGVLGARADSWCPGVTSDVS